MRIFQLAIVTALAILPFVASAQAQLAADFPIYDVNGRCATRGEMPYVRACWKMEQEAYNDLKLSWTQIPAQAKQNCLAIVNKYPVFNYSNLDKCVDNWMVAHRLDNAQPFQFR